ncbi:helix-turn-helix transcriptional regulator [Amycolatopsis sp. CA-128772]|uniref:helix-turn-helix transcriptional regulator n=1 Tax=Amycolatopsis sp. CA-128772 TaxID=2073159 RepID=UPI000CD12B1C|nr:helix-turn-helix transcriptional regulator [Amycolatopsis sp. CA-128772]
MLGKANVPTAETAWALKRAGCPDLAARLHAAVDDVLGRYDPDAGAERADREILGRLLEVEESWLRKSPQSGQLLQIERPPAADLPGVEVRILPGLTTWLAVVDSTAVVFPQRQDRTVLRAPGVLAVAIWAFQQARPAPPSGAVPPQLSQLEVRILRCLSAGLKDEQAARRLDISVRTYRRRVTALCDRLHASSRFEAGVAAARRGLV